MTQDAGQMTEILPVEWQLETDDGRLISLDVPRWLGSVDRVDEGVLERAVGPVLDIGCGPGRHVHALTQRDVEALGLDISPSAVALARRKGVPVLQRSVFEALLHPGRWHSALLLDGSIGIGGDPVALLRRVAELLSAHGHALVETEPPDEPSEILTVRVAQGTGTQGEWFPWARVSFADIGSIAAEAGFDLADKWDDSGRWFAQLERARTGGSRRT